MLVKPRYGKFKENESIIKETKITKLKRHRSETKSDKPYDMVDSEDPLVTDDENIKKIDLSLQNKHLSKDEADNDYRILEPFRSLGIVIDNNPLCYFKRAHERFLLASNNHSFLLYNCERLSLERISPPLPKKINALAISKNIVFTATENIILSWSKIHIVNEYVGHKHKVIQILLFEKLLISLDEQGNLLIFDVFTKQILKQLKLNAKFFYHPATYLNKILYTDGFNLFLYNIKSESQIYKFEHLRNEGDGEITCIEQSPVIDVIGVGFSSGIIKIINILTDKVIQEFNMSSRIIGLTFSSSIKLKISLLATTDMSGDIVFWDLNNRQKHYVLKTPHDEKIVSNLNFLPNEPILVSASGDSNSIKMWQFEKESTVPIILKQRSGHFTNPHMVRFYGDDDKQLLSISNDGSLRKTSLYNEQQNCEFSRNHIPNSIKQGNINFKINAPNLFDFNEFRERDWSNVLTCHFNQNTPLLWNYENHVISNVPVVIKTASICTSVSVSMCGNFGFAGFENGAIEKFNMQSGLHRLSFEGGFIIIKLGNLSHLKSVLSLKSDSLNSTLISIGLDSKLNFWDIYTGKILNSKELDFSADHMEINRDNGLVAISKTNFEIEIYDKSTYKKVRKFVGHKNKVNDLCFSKDSSWLLSVSLDKSLKIWDVLSGLLIEWIEFKKTPISLSISNNNQFIATSFVGSNGIYLWLNRTQFIDLIQNQSVKTPVKVDLPYASRIRKFKSRKELYKEKKDEETNLPQIKHKLSLDIKNYNMGNKLITLSGENQIKYRIIQNLELIQERNDPKIKKKEKTKAPFFLFNINDLKMENNSKASKQANELLTILENYSHFSSKSSEKKTNKLKSEFILKDLLQNYSERRVTFTEINKVLSLLNPYLIDLEIRNLDPILNNKDGYLLYFLQYIYDSLESANNFDLVNSYLNRFLKIYPNYCFSNPTLSDELFKINEKIEEYTSDLDCLFNTTLSLISNFAQIQI